MVSSRHRLPVAVAALIVLALVRFYSFRGPTETPLSNTSAKIASAKERLEQNLEEQNRGLKHALEAARASLKQAVEVAIPTAAAAQASVKQDKPGGTEGFAYVFYATTDNYACSVLVNIHRLKEVLHTTLAIHVLASDDVSKDMLDAISAAGAVLHMQAPPEMPEDAVVYYKDSLLKLRAFEMHQLSPGLTRVLALDADQLVMQNMDHLFTDLPEVDLAAPRAYWLKKGWIASTFMLISPSDRLWAMIERAMQRNMLKTQTTRYDMDLVNDALGDTVMMLSGEYVCLNSHWEDWNLPRWYHPEGALNWTTIRTINELAKPPEPYHDGNPGNKAKRQLFTDTDLAVEPPPTPALQPAPQLHQQPQGAVSSPTQALPTPLYPPLPDPVRVPLQPATPSPRFPLAHPLALELERLQDTAAVIHFSAVGKPWSFEPENVEQTRPDAHPLLAEQFTVWREAAEAVCPGGAVARPEKLLSPSISLAAPLPMETQTVMTATTLSMYVRPLAGFGVPVSTTW